VKAFGKTIRIFLIEGDPNGRMTAELSNWTGKAFKIPRIQVKDCGDRPELDSTGIYFLFGQNEDGHSQIYIGEAESILKRLGQHLSQKEFWNEVIAFISKDENLNKAHAKYLESRFYEIAKTGGRYTVENSIKPTQSSISESDRAEMEEYVENVKLLVNALGHKVFEGKRETVVVGTRTLFSIKSVRGAEATGQPTSEGFVVFKGSRAAIVVVDSMPKGFNAHRDQLLANGILNLDGGQCTFSEDTIFSSPSTAAAIVMGRNANGLIEWRLPDGRTLRDFEAKAEGATES